MAETKDTAQMKWNASWQEKGVVLWDKRKVHIFSQLKFSEDVSYNKSALRTIWIPKFRTN